MSENYDNKMRGIYGWTVEDGKAVPPVHRFPKAVKDRLDYFAEMMEDGLSLRGCLEFVFSETEPHDYSFGATKDWLPQDDIFKKWVGTTEIVAWTEAVIYLLYGNWTDVPDGQVELELAENKPILDYGQEFNELAKNVKGFAEQYGIDVNRDEFCLIQPYDEGHSITMRAVEEDGRRQLKVEIFDNLHILPVKSGTLSIFREVADDSEV